MKNLNKRSREVIKTTKGEFFCCGLIDVNN